MTCDFRELFDDDNTDCRILYWHLAPYLLCVKCQFFYVMVHQCTKHYARSDTVMFMCTKGPATISPCLVLSPYRVTALPPAERVLSSPGSCRQIGSFRSRDKGPRRFWFSKRLSRERWHGRVTRKNREDITRNKRI